MPVNLFNAHETPAGLRDQTHASREKQHAPIQAQYVENNQRSMRDLQTMWDKKIIKNVLICLRRTLRVSGGSIRGE
jgi:hypothetical protein